MALGNRDDQILTEWQLKTGQAVKSVDELAKAIRREQAHEKKLALIRNELDRETKELAESEKRLVTSKKESAAATKAATMAGNLYAMAIAKGIDVLKDITKNTGAYNQVLNAYTGNIESARRATQGLVSNFDLMAKYNELQVLGVKLTSEQYDAMLANLDKLSAAMGKEMTYSLESATTALARQSKLMADNVGVIMPEAKQLYQDFALAVNKSVKELTDAEKAQAFQMEFLRQLEVKAKDLPARMTSGAITWSAAWQGLKNTAQDLAAVLDRRLGMALETDYMLMNRLRRGTDALTFSIKDAIIEIKKFQRETDERAESYGFGLRGAGATMKGGALGLEEHTENIMFQRRVLGTSAEGKGTWKGPKGPRRRGRAKRSKAKEWWRLPDEPQELRSVADVLADYDKEYAAKEKQIQQEYDFQKAMAARKQKDADEIAAIEKKIQGYKDLSAVIGDAQTQVQNMAVGALADLTAGMWDAADAAIMGSESFGMAMAKMTKSVLLSVAKEATVMAIMEMAKYAASMFTATEHLYAAGMFAAAAAAAGGAGLGVSAGIKAAGGYDTKKAPEKDRESSYRARAGRRSTEGQTVHVHLHIDSRKNAALSHIQDQLLVAKIKKAA